MAGVLSYLEKRKKSSSDYYSFYIDIYSIAFATADLLCHNGWCCRGDDSAADNNTRAGDDYFHDEIGGVGGGGGSERGGRPQEMLEPGPLESVFE